MNKNNNDFQKYLEENLEDKQFKKYFNLFGIKLKIKYKLFKLKRMVFNLWKK